MPVTAFKNGKKQVFSDLGWKLLGKNKHGWVEKSAVVIENTVKKSEAPNMGPKNPADEDVTSKSKTVIITSTTGKTDEEILEESGKTNSEDNGGSKKVDTKEEFMNALEGISRTQIKDFFDQQKPAVKYKNLAKESDLKLQLAEYLNYDIVKLQEAAL